MTENYERERKEAFRQLLGKVDQHLATAKKAAPQLVRPATLVIDTTEADLQSWVLTEKALSHLDHGWQDREPGLVTEAVAKMSLLNSQFAKGLRVHRPENFECDMLPLAGSDRDVALFVAQDMVNAAVAGIPAREKAVRERIDSIRPEKLSELIRQDPDEVRGQLSQSFNTLVKAYKGVCATLQREIKALSIVRNFN